MLIRPTRADTINSVPCIPHNVKLMVDNLNLEEESGIWQTKLKCTGQLRNLNDELLVG